MATPTVIGINFGGSASSVAVISKEGLPDCIANDDGERQISNAMSFSGDEEYIGIPAKSQLVRNNANTILGFRNLLGKSYTSVSSLTSPFMSAPLVSGTDGSPAFKVSIKDVEKTLTAQEISTRYLSMLIGFASDFLGRTIDAAVLAIPEDFSEDQCKALEKACNESANLKVLQFLHESAAACVAYGVTVPAIEGGFGASKTSQDRNVVVLDVGATSTTVTVLAAREGIYVPLSSVRDPNLGGESFDTTLISFFSKEFTKKTKVTLEKSNHRANMKLRLACEVTKRTLSASNSATCSVESLAEGLDFSGSINRSRFDLLSAKIYESISERILEALKKSDLDPLQVQEIVLIGGTCKNPTLSERIGLLFPESTLISSQIEPDQAIARGCVLQALALSKLSPDEISYIPPTKSTLIPSKVPIVSRPIGLMVPAPRHNGYSSTNTPGLVEGQMFVTIVEANTPLPARRIVEVPFEKEAKGVKLAVWEGQEEIHVEAPTPKQANGSKKPNKDSDDEDSEDEEEDEDTKTRIIKPLKQLAELIIKVQPSQGKGKAINSVNLSIIISKDGKLEIEAKQNGLEKAESQKLDL